MAIQTSRFLLAVKAENLKSDFLSCLFSQQENFTCGTQYTGVLITALQIRQIMKYLIINCEKQNKDNFIVLT